MSDNKKIIQGGDSTVYEQLGNLPVGTPVRVEIPTLGWVDTVLEAGLCPEINPDTRQVTIAGKTFYASDRVYNRGWNIEIPILPQTPEDGIYAFDSEWNGPHVYKRVWKYRAGEWRDSEGRDLKVHDNPQASFEEGILKKVRF